MTAQVAADLRAAAEVLRRDGWTQRLMHRGGCHCAVGAIEVAVDPEWRDETKGWDDDTSARFSEAVKRVKALVELPVTQWNDQPSRTADEVIAALEAAADAAEATQ